MPGVPFRIPQVEDNSEGWGPTTVPQELKDVPYAPFGKGDKLGRVSDFTAQGFNKNYNRYPQGGRNMELLNPVFNFFHNEEEDQFHLVDSKPVSKGRGRGRFQPNRFQQRREQAEKRGEPVDTKQSRRQQQMQRNRWQQRDNQRVYTSSVDIRPDWRVVEQVNFPALAKLSLSVGEPVDLAFCGELAHYDKSYDRVTPKMEKRVEKSNRVFKNVTTSEDPFMIKLAAEDKAQVFATDTLITALMCAPRSVYPWDLIIAKRGKQVFLDERPGGTLSLISVSETAPEPVPEEKDNINGLQQLSVEATNANNHFSQQVLLHGGEKYPCGEPLPFSAEDGQPLAATAYRYRKWNIGEECEIMVRCGLDGVVNMKNQDQLISIRSLLEYDSKATGIDWRTKLDSQRGAVLATELKNNACKLARWTAQSLLSGADIIKLGYLSRLSGRDNVNHAILGTQNAKPREFAQQINLNMDNCWGIVRAVVDLVLQQEDGKYLLIKDPGKPMIRLYELPGEAFEAQYAEEGEEEDADAEAEAGGQAVQGNEEDDD